MGGLREVFGEEMVLGDGGWESWTGEEALW
jgi:hypothetical protein